MTTRPTGAFAQYAVLAVAALALIGLYAWGTASTRVSFDPVGNTGLVAFTAVALFGLMVLGPARSRATPGRRLALITLRTGVIALVILVMLRPTLVYRAIHKQTATLLVLIDVSRSMMVADDGGKSRWARLQETLSATAGDFEQLAGDLDVKFYGFDAELRPLDFADGKLSLPPAPEGDETAIAWNINESAQKNAGQRLVATIVLTDGAQRANPPRDGDPILAARRAKDLGYPIHSVVFGSIESQGQLRDAAIEKLIANQTVFVKNELTVTGQVRLSGYVNQNVPVQLLFETAPGKMEVVATAQARATSDGELVPIEMVYAPQVPGEHKLTLRIPPREGELVTSNNEDTTYVTVLKGGLRVLFLTGLMRDEQTFILRALRASRDMKVDYFRLNAQRADQRSDRVNQALSEGLAPGKYDVYILGDLDADAFLPGELLRLRDTVNAGAGLIMLGGGHSFGPGGYAETPLADVLPVEMSPLERQHFGEALREDVHINRPLKMRPGPLAGRQFVTLLTAPERNKQFWLSLPSLDGANKFRGVKDAPIWLEGPNAEPLLVAGNSAAGRVLAFAGDTTWRWVMHGFGEAHKRFWRQAVLWLAKKDQTNEGRVWIDLEERRVRFGGRINFTAGAQNAQGEPLDDAEFEGDIVLPDGKRETLKLNRQGQQITGTFKQTQAPGEYTITLRASHQGESLGAATARFLVFKQELELERPAADLGAMLRLSSMTPGGEAITPEAFPALLEEIKQAPRELEVEELTKTSLWDKWLVCLLLGCLLTGEWYLRKKWGLV